MAFFCYLDCSGSSTDKNRQKAISVGGYISPQKAWAEFEVLWQYILYRYGIREFHMNEYAQSTGEFKKWKNDATKRMHFMVSVTDAVNSLMMQSVGMSLHLEAYDKFNERFLLQETIGSPYAVAACTAFSHVVEWHERLRINEPLLTFFEKGDNSQHDLRLMLDRLTWNVDLVHMPEFMAKRWVDRENKVHNMYPFQACDFIAYEQAKAVANTLRGNNQPRKSLRRANLRDPTMWQIIREPKLAAFVKNFGIPRRT
jgi:hypothetical protein